MVAAMRDEAGGAPPSGVAAPACAAPTPRRAGDAAEGAEAPGSAEAVAAGAIAAVARQGFAVLAPSDTRAMLGAAAAAPDAWAGFADSYERLELDGHMGDGGRYRLRRYAAYAVGADGGRPVRLPHRPHRQSLEHNRLNGGVDRWFAPILPDVADGPTLPAVLGACQRMADGLRPRPEGDGWQIEVHQFRIVGAPGRPGLPTPEGVHRDGVDLVFIMLVGRRNADGGRSMIEDAQGRRLAEFCLAEPMQAVVLDDRRLRHGATSVVPVDAEAPAHRDVLVVTFRRGHGAQD